MKQELIDKACNIVGFENQATELKYALSKPVSVTDKKPEYVERDIQFVYHGFKIALDKVEQYPELIQPTLYDTMLLIKQKYKQLTKFTLNYYDVSAVSLAVNHLQRINKINSVFAKSNQYKAKYDQHKADKKIATNLSNEIKQMLDKIK